ncbi:hypothetical protein PR202_gb11875 [Eleusine coracana subsp. coracana]|uniref:Uncharacterized protein n=1 Tax=Eleusine coracana subsp. coracana TaxID=191504 RepID=A0AAV5EN08_ELECO|nr:hypothetical protein PR202_gb11875 [Eleusine coracana subsp. coracana]
MPGSFVFAAVYSSVPCPCICDQKLGACRWGVPLRAHHWVPKAFWLAAGPEEVFGLGINRERVEQMEFRLKEDILQEASRYGNKILVTDELPSGQMVDQWESVRSNTVKTPLEVYEELQHQGYLVDYERVPITDEKAPKEGDFDNLVCRISQVDLETEIVFNCQMGRGRTTTGIPRTSSIGKVFHAGNDVDDYMPSTEEAILRGEYAVIRSLVRVLEGGVEGKRQVDKVIDKCDTMQNLREAIATYRNSILRQPDEMKREASLSFFVEYLELEVSFSDWMRARPELYSILRRLLRRDPMGALGYSSSKPPLTKIVESSDGRPHEMDVVAAMRNGEVLGRLTVLKSDHCPGSHSLNLPKRVEGAPNFRKVPGFPVYGVANPTVDGIRAVIQRISTNKGGRAILWHNMREEPVIYINGKPFVLREVERPCKNMLEYTGIDRDRVERMEARLKEDILREAERYDGAIMVIHETDSGEIFDTWENVDNDAVLTPLELLARILLLYSIARPIRIPACQNSQEDDNDDGYSSGAETMDHNGHMNSESWKPRTLTKLSSGLGINDILLLRKITRLFDNGIECRQTLDAVIDRCSALQNIRQAVLQYTKVINQQHVEPRVRRVALNRGAEYLERYLKLIAFSAYLGSEAFDGFCGQGEATISFKGWLQQRPEIQTMKWSIRLRPGRFFTVPQEPKVTYPPSQGDLTMETIVKARNGSVLGKGSILKMYFFPGQRRSSNVNFRGAPHVFKVIVTDLREEVVVYIKGTPFVLRELDQPVDTLKHVEGIEARLKEDILSEIRQLGDAKFVMEQTAETHFVSTSLTKTMSIKTSTDIALRQGDYRDILNLTRVLVYGPKSKQEVDTVIDRCSGAGHLREDILHYRKALQDCSNDDDDDEERSYLYDMGTKALRRYFFLITYRSYLYSTSLREATFTSWMKARPELGHLCDNLKLDK